MIGVFPAAEHRSRTNLFAALETSFSVRFQGREAGAWDGLDAAVLFGLEHWPRLPPMPCLVLPPPEARREARCARPRVVELASSEVLDRPLRGLRLADLQTTGPAVPALQTGDVPLATSEEGPVWVQRPGVAGRWVVSAAPDELAPGEGLRDQLHPGRFLGLLAVVHLLRHLQGEEATRAGHLRACFVIDDPNLHGPRYGHIRYLELFEHARRHGYHIAMASIPLDYWLVHRRTAELFRTGSRHLSLTVHGNNHERSELLRFANEAAALASAGQALRRAQALETRSSIPVSRVMCAPHEVCSPATVRALFRVGFEGLAFDPRRDRERASRTGPLGGWEPAQLLDGGLPVLPRYSLSAADELAFHAYLGLPLILYGHQQDLAGGLDVLGDAAARIGALGDVQWLSLGEIAYTNRTVRFDGTRVTVRMYTRHTTVAVPEDARELLVELPPARAGADVLVRCGLQTAPVRLGPSGRARVGFAAPFQRATELVVTAPDAVSPTDVPAPRTRLQPVARRVLTEARDRLAPIGLPPSPERG
ncbi:MAG: hypothetical protein LBJ87_03775 [bacterium]|nr:hypothetical protein [bacterium]